MVDTQQNERTLHEFLSRADKDFVAKVGLVGLLLQAAKLSSDEFHAFLDECIEGASELHVAKNLGLSESKEMEDEPGYQKPEQGNGGS